MSLETGTTGGARRPGEGAGTLDREFVINQRGTDYVMYGGLLGAAHRQGLKSMVTKLVQIPLAENGMVAICHAAVTTAKGVYEGIGDASPQNVGSGAATRLIGMAETRAKARALRDALNIRAELIDEAPGAGGAALTLQDSGRRWTGGWVPGRTESGTAPARPSGAGGLVGRR